MGLYDVIDKWIAWLKGSAGEILCIPKTSKKNQDNSRYNHLELHQFHMLLYTAEKCTEAFEVC
jgi:hypothetical protein